jgi:hypothetical protein
MLFLCREFLFGSQQSLLCREFSIWLSTKNRALGKACDSGSDRRERAEDTEMVERRKRAGTALSRL